VADQNIKTQTAPSRRASAGRPNASFLLVVIAGPDQGKVFSIPATSAARVLVGQSSACTIRLGDPHVSRRHLALEVLGPSLHVTDLGSHNGTYANEVAVADATLWGGETLRIGQTTFRIDLEERFVQSDVTEATSFGRILGASFEMRRLYPFFEQLAHSTWPVLIEGETGTGKELLAETLHEAGSRAGGPFVILDATLTSTHRLDKTLFGEEARNRPGIFEQAHGGTLVIDEVGELDPQLQRKLLRVIERQEIQRVGATAPRRIDVRFLTTTRLDLDRLVQDGTLREDLYYRLVMSRVELPPLRRREGDVVFLARHFWREFGGTGKPDETIMNALQHQSWPGNVRELRNRIAQLVAFGERPTSPPIAPVGGRATPTEDLFERVLLQDLPLVRAREQVVEEFERQYVERVLAAHGGSVVKAAAASGLARRYFQLLRVKRTQKA
jgi:DNA-binding NtrC family response regulator